jgi:hypothetical protein
MRTQFGASFAAVRSVAGKGFNFRRGFPATPALAAPAPAQNAPSHDRRRQEKGG